MSQITPDPLNKVEIVLYPERVRLFTALTIPSEVSVRLAELLKVLRPTATLNWAPPENYHVTVRFIGELPERQFETAITALNTLAVRAPLSVAVRGIGWMPNPHSPRALFAGIDGGEPLARLAAYTDAALAAVGLPPENRVFRPHLTLARIRSKDTSLARLRQAIAALDTTDFGSFSSTTVALFASKPGAAASVYTQLTEIRFAQ